MHWEQPLEYASISDIGFRRQMNQDAYRVQLCPERQTWEQYGHLFVVCDGMGGHAVGELASKIAIDTIPQVFFKIREGNTESCLRKAIEIANLNINDRGTQNHDFERMGTTCSTLVLSPRGAIIGHVGDSRVYRVRGQEVEQLTFDHSLQWELLRQGKMSPEEIFLKQPRNVITRSLGPMPEVQVDVEGPHPILPGDVYLLCSDGLTGHINDPEIGMITRHLPPAVASRLLVHLANLRGGSDNITVVIVRVGDIPPGMEAAPAEPEETEAESSLSWQGLLTLWVIAGFFVLAVCLMILGRWESGLVFLGLALAVATGSAAYWSTKRRQSPILQKSVRNQTSGPYRHASAKLLPQFVSHLAALEAELQRTGHEEGWDIDWARHQSASGNAQSFLSHNRLEDALSELAQSLDILMAGVQTHRKNRQHQARWGKPARPIRRNGEDKGS